MKSIKYVSHLLAKGSVLAAFILSASLSFASNQTGTLNGVLIRASDGLIYVTMTGGERTGDRPACATHSYWMIKDENSEAGKRQYSALLAAKLSGATVTIWGANTCTRWGDGEDINSIRIAD